MVAFDSVSSMVFKLKILWLLEMKFEFGAKFKTVLLLEFGFEIGVVRGELEIGL